jgi:iron complex outermembrane recepter protein
VNWKRHVILLMALLLPQAALADSKDDARRHFKAGLTAAQNEDFEIALQHFLQAQEAYPHPATLYNIARSYTDLNDLPNALTYYRLYRDGVPDKAPDIDPVIAALEARAGAGMGPVVEPTADGVARGDLEIEGATEEELARLKALAAELKALSDAIEGRSGQAVSLDPSTGAFVQVAPDGGADGADVDLSTIGLPDGGLIDDAYERIVVTASRYGQEPLDSPSTTTILSEGDIRMSGATNLPDLLRRVVGVDVMALSAAHSEVSIRGFNRELNNKVLLLIDGRSTYWDFIGASFWIGLPVSLEEVERIEVIRGPGSAVYGANAVTGVINIITRTPGDQPGTTVRLDGGLPGLGRGTFLTSGRSGPTSYRFSAGFDQHRRWNRDYSDEDMATFDPLFDNQDRASKLFRAMGRVDRSFGEKGFGSISGGYSTGQFEFYNIGALGDYGIDFTSFFLRGDAAYGPVHLRSFWNSDAGYTGPWLEPAGAQRALGSAVDNDAVDIEIEAPVEFNTGPVDHKLNAGLGYRYKAISFGLLQGGVDNKFVEHHAAFFFNEEASIGIMKVVASARVDKHPLIPDISQTISPRGALIARVAEETSVRVTGGTSFRAPNSVESYMDFNLPSSANGAFITDLGNNPNDAIDGTLRPERILTVEAGMHDQSTDFHTADAVVYMNRVKDLIGLDEVTPSLDYFNEEENGYEAGTTGWVNLPPAYTGVGFEAELETFPADGLDVYGNVNVMRVVSNDGGETSIDGSASLVKFNLGTMYRTPWRTDFTLDSHFVGPQTWTLREFDAGGNIVFNDSDIPARMLLTARVGFRPIPDDDFEVAATWWNITGAQNGYQEHPKGQLVGSRIFATLKYKF